jgi:Ca2+-binding EF-hand superfamily protein
MNVTKASGLHHLSNAAFGDGPTAGSHHSPPTKYCMCMNCGQELWADSITTTVSGCFACGAQQAGPYQVAGKDQPPQNSNASEDIFLGNLRKSRAHMQQSLPGILPPGQDSMMPSQIQQRASLRPSSQNSGIGASELLLDQMRRFRTESFNPGPLRQSRSKDKVDSDGASDRTSSRSSAQVSKLLARQVQNYDPQTATVNSSKHKLEERRKRLNEIHCSKGGAGRQMRSQSTPCLPGISELVPQPSSPIPTGSHMLDSVLGKLNKPKLLGALDRMVKEVHTNRKTLKVALNEFDLNGDGILSKEETAIGLRKLGVTLLPSELDAIMRAFDVDQKGSVEVDGLIDIMTIYQAHFKFDQASRKEMLDAQVQKRNTFKSHKIVSFCAQESFPDGRHRRVARTRLLN